MVGLRHGVYRTQQFYMGTFLAYRTDDRNIVAGADGLVDHWPWPNTQIGFNVERSLGAYGGGNPNASRGVLFGRYVMMYSDSLYLPPFNYVEAFVGALDRTLPVPRNPAPQLNNFEHQTIAGMHYHLYYLTPYWDPEGGIAFDATYQEGMPVFGGQQESHQVTSQFSFVKTMPAWMNWTKTIPGLGWFMDTRLAMHQSAVISVPAPCSVNSSSSSTWGMRPSRMTAALTPPSTASIAVSILGIMPPEMVPSAIRPRASRTVSSRDQLLVLIQHAFDIGQQHQALGFRAPATAPATVSALML